MLSPEDVVRIRAEIERLEEARKWFNDSGILKQIDLWIADEKKKGQTSSLAMPHKGCHPFII